MTKKNAAVIGYGGMGAGFHCEKLLKSDVCNLAGIYDIDESKRALAASRGIKVYNTREELLADPTIDMVTIATPNDVHEEIAIAALEAGKNVISEKPVTLSMDSLERMIAASNPPNNPNILKSPPIMLTVRKMANAIAKYLITF